MTFCSPVDDLKCYEECLSQLRTAVGHSEGEREGQSQAAEMAQRAHALQQFYQQTLWGLLTQVELSKHQPQWRSATTEIHRHMRLLSVEVRFARSARQGSLRQQRLEQIAQRLEQLQGFTQVLIALVNGEPLAKSPMTS